MAEPKTLTDPNPNVNVEALLDAIYRAEGGSRARTPYGILSVPVADEAEARAVARRTVLHALQDWRKGGCRGSWLSAVAARYCPAQADPQGHKNWKKNVGTFYAWRIRL